MVGTFQGISDSSSGNWVRIKSITDLRVLSLVGFSEAKYSSIELNFGRLRERGQLGVLIPNWLAYEAGAEALPLWEEIWPGPAMKLVGPLAGGSPGLRLAFALEIERHCIADEIHHCRLIDLVAFMNVDGAPDIPLEAGVE